MKHKIPVLTALLLILLTLTGCAAAEQPAASTAEPPTEQVTEAPQSTGEAPAEQVTEAPQSGAEAPETEETAQPKGLVVYFSRTGEQYGVGVIDKGNTAIVAEMIAEQTGADLFEILPAEDTYPTTYDELTDVAKREQNENARPAIGGELPDLTQYDTVFIGAPVWWGDWPMILYTFFEENEAALAGKTLIPFCTHAGSGLSGFDYKLAEACPHSTVGTGLAVTGKDAQNHPDRVREDVTDWLNELGY